LGEPLVSVIVPVYNTLPYLDMCLASIRNQTYRNIQLIIVDDGSTDGSSEICDKHARDDARVLVIHEQNSGVSSARNTGLSVSTGSFIMFVDSDDWIDENTIEELIKLQKTSDYDIILFGFYKENVRLDQVTLIRNTNQSYKRKEELTLKIPSMIEDGSLHQLWNKFYKASILRNNNLFFTDWLNLAEDALFNYHAFLKADSLYITEKCFYHYMMRENSLAHRYHPMKYKMLIYVNDRLQELIKAGADYKNYKPSADLIRFKSLFSSISDLFHQDCTLTRKDKRVFLQKIVDNESSFPYILDNRLHRILLFILRTQSISLIYLAAFLIYKLRQAFRASFMANHPAWRKDMKTKFKKKLLSLASRTKAGKAAWTLLSKLKHGLHRKRRTRCVTEFFRRLKETNCRYVVLRWFDNLPVLRYADDMDILVHDDDIEIMDSLLHRWIWKESIPCDVYSVNGLPGYDYKGTACFPPPAAERMLQRAVVNQTGIRIPSKEDHFYSLAFHVLYHKGSISGLPVSRSVPPRYVNKRHDYTKILGEMAKELGLNIEINMLSLDRLLKAQGWGLTKPMLEKYDLEKELHLC
jgi:glycosyltransferase involved in cell wall biosynthesis